MTMVIGSLFTGYGGLEQGVASALRSAGAGPARVAWVSDIDPGARKILAHRYPGVPNLGDITQVDWSAVEPVDVPAGGFPCQDVSLAGNRAGLRPDTRSGLWTQMAYAISVLRPRIVVAENVRGLLSAPAHSNMEPCPWCLGDTDGEPPLRALGAVLADLADLGYDARWYGLRASDVGAPHGRFRVFVVACPADTDDVRSNRTGLHRPGERRRSEPSHRGVSAADVTRPQGGEPAARHNMSARRSSPDTLRDGRHEGRTEPERIIGGPDAPERREPAAAADTSRERHAREAQERQRAWRVAVDRGAAAAADTDRSGPVGVRRVDTSGRDTHGRHRPDQDGDPTQSTSWGPYGPAIARWEAVLGRNTPSPTETPSKGGQRLSPRFVEWMMGLPDGWVTDVPGLSRNDMLRALGNGVVPHQAARALRILLAGQDVL